MTSYSDAQPKLVEAALLYVARRCRFVLDAERDAQSPPERVPLEVEREALDVIAMARWKEQP